MNLLLNIDALSCIHRARAGIIPYIVTDRDRIFFLLAQDRKTHDLSDFGGGGKKGENVWETAEREFREESSDIFPKLPKSRRNVVLLDGNMALIFVNIPEEWRRISIEFCDHPNTEVSSVKWVSEEQFRALLKEDDMEKMWKKIQRFISKTPLGPLLTMLRTQKLE